jgi:hypothetical protein
MKVSELIEKLSKFDGELQVVIVNDEGGWDNINAWAIVRGSLDDDDMMQPDDDGDMVGIGVD